MSGTIKENEETKFVTKESLREKFYSVEKKVLGNHMITRRRFCVGLGFVVLMFCGITAFTIYIFYTQVCLVWTSQKPKQLSRSR